MFLNLETIPPFYKGYVKLVEQPDALLAMRISGYRTMELIHSIPEAKRDFRYADGKWSIREVLCHMIDAERIFAYRALRFARNDKTPLAGAAFHRQFHGANGLWRLVQRHIPFRQNLRGASYHSLQSAGPGMQISFQHQSCDKALP